jgi:hypothetical protein
MVLSVLMCWSLVVGIVERVRIRRGVPGVLGGGGLGCVGGGFVAVVAEAVDA